MKLVIYQERTPYARQMRKVWGEHPAMGMSHLRQPTYRGGYSNTLTSVTKDNLIIEITEYPCQT